MDSGKIPNPNDRENIEQLENVISQLEVKERLIPNYAAHLQCYCRKGKTHEALHLFPRFLK